MDLWRELLISGLQSENYKHGYINDDILKNIIENRCYQVLLQLKQTIDDENLADQDCFIKIEEILYTLEKNGIFCNRHDFG